MKYETDSLKVGNCHVTLEAETLRDKAAREILCAMIGNPNVVGLVGVTQSCVYKLDNAVSRTALCHRAYMIVDTLAEAGKMKMGVSDER